MKKGRFPMEISIFFYFFYCLLILAVYFVNFCLGDAA